MQANTTQNSTAFPSTAKQSLKVGQEINEHGLIWRKLSTGKGSWRYDFRINGKRFKGTLGKEHYGMTLSAARKKFSEAKARATLEAPVNLQQANSPAFKLFTDVAEEYLDWAEINLQAFRQTLNKYNNHLLPRFPEILLKDITTTDVENLKTALLDTNYSPSSIKKIISLLSSIFTHAKKSDHAIFNPTKGLSKLRNIDKEIQTLSKAEVVNLIDASKGNSQSIAIIGLAAYMGLRPSEILALEWTNVNFDKEEITICQSVVEGKLKETTKSGKIRIIPISTNLLTILKKHKLASENHSFVIVNKDGEHYYQIQKVFGKIKKLSADDFDGGIYILRHTFATTAVTNRVDLPTIQKWMGHSDIKTTMRYIHINTKHSVNQMKLMG